jgi:hypothetical protein
MLECLLQEFAWMGYDASQLEALFHHAGYPLLGQLRELLGDDVVREQILNLRNRWGTLKFQEAIAEPEEELEPDVFQIEWTGQVSFRDPSSGQFPRGV